MSYTLNDYNALMDAVTKAYGKDVWDGITSAKDFYSSDFAQKITQVEGVNAVYLKDGSVAYYTYGNKIVGASSSVGNVANSNVGMTTLTETLETPASVTVESGTGKVLAESGMKTVSTGSKVATVVGNVATGVMAVGCGVQLGALIDSTLYNANPDFWDEHNMSNLNPQTWDTLCSTQGGKDVFNMVFGIDKDTGKSQAYADERTLAYICQYLISQGAFSIGESVDLTDTSILSYGQYYNFPLRISDNIYTFHNEYYTNYRNMSIEIASGTIYIVPFLNSARRIRILCYAETNGVINIYRDDSLYTTINATAGTTYTAVSDRTSNFSSDWYNEFTLSANEIPDLTSDITKIFTYGDVETSGGVDGISKQDGATTPSGITTDMTIPEVIAQLQTLYPSLFDDAIYDDVIQDDGTIDRHIYIPVAIPDTIPKDDTTGNLKPTGGVDLQQGDTVIDDESIDALIDALIEILTTPDPYDPTKTPTDNNAPDTGDGTTPTVVLPTGSANALYSIYNPSQAQLNSFGSWLWSSNFVDQLLKIFNDPMQAIIGLHKVFATPITSGTGNIKVGYLDSGVGSNLVSNQYTEIDCGTIDLFEYFSNVLDYLHTDVYLYLPFVGIVQLNVDDVMRSSINVKYKIDVLTGACLCSVYINRDLSGGQLYTYSGNCAVQYPLSSGSYMGIVTSILGIAGSVAGTIASGGAMLPMALGVGASAISGAKTHVEHSGSISGNAGAMGIKKPYLIIRRPQTAIANNFDEFDGVSNNVFGLLSSYSGFNRIKYVNLENIDVATGEELSEIENILKDGVII